MKPLEVDFNGGIILTVFIITFIGAENGRQEAYKMDNYPNCFPKFYLHVLITIISTLRGNLVRDRKNSSRILTHSYAI